jgi:DNA-directed RNA polymerase specialized sigma24 family protein
LRPEDRDVFLLCVLGELTYVEAALAHELPAGTVATRMRRARDVLAAELRGVANERSSDDD